MRKLSRVIGLCCQPEQILCLFPGGLGALREGLELGCLIGRGLYRQRVIEIRQTGVATSSTPCAAGRTPPAAAVSGVLTQSDACTKQQNSKQGQFM